MTGLEDRLVGGFSPLTCLELVDKLTDEQIMRESGRILDPDIVSKLPRSTRSGNDINGARDALRGHFQFLVGQEQDDLLNLLFNSVNNLTDMITRHTEDSTRRVESARKQFEELQKDIAQEQTLSSTTAGATSTCCSAPLIPSTAPSQRPHGNITDSESGTLPFETLDGSCFETFSTSLLNDDVIYDRTFPNRRVAYYGQFSYRYSGGFHPARDVPESSYLSEIIKVLKTRHPEFNFNSVMVTSYDAPHSCIPPHSDNEASISRDSNIITLSLGSPREVVFRRKIPGEYKKVTFTATHASLDLSYFIPSYQ